MPDYEGFRDVIIGVLDKLNQLETLFKAMEHKAEAQAALAEISAYRVTARGFLARLRMLETEGGEGALVTRGGPPLEAAPPLVTGCPTSRDSENSKNSLSQREMLRRAGLRHD